MVVVVGLSVDVVGLAVVVVGLIVVVVGLIVAVVDVTRMVVVVGLIVAEVVVAPMNWPAGAVGWFSIIRLIAAIASIPRTIRRFLFFGLFLVFGVVEAGSMLYFWNTMFKYFPFG